MKRSPRILLEDILESIGQIEAYTRELSVSDFGENVQVQDAVIRRLEIIGEAVKGVPRDVTAQYPEVPWSDIAGTRDIVIHEYFRVDLEMAWGMVRQDLPELRRQIERILADLA